MDLTKAATDALAERERQRSAEGWTEAHDDEHWHGELADAGACYIATTRAYRADTLAGRDHEPIAVYSDLWPRGWRWNPKTRREDLVRGIALGLAEIERLDRAEARESAARKGK